MFKWILRDMIAALFSNVGFQLLDSGLLTLDA